MPSADPARQLAIEAAHQLLRDLAARAIVLAAPVSHCARDDVANMQALVILGPTDPWTLTVEEKAALLAQLDRLGRRETSYSAAVTSQASQRQPSALDRDILELLGRAGPLKGLVIARRLGRGYPYVRKRLALLVQTGRLRHVESEGYAVTSQREGAEASGEDVAEGT